MHHQSSRYAIHFRDDPENIGEQLSNDSNSVRRVRSRSSSLLRVSRIVVRFGLVHPVRSADTAATRANEDAIKDGDEPFGAGSASTSPAGEER